MLSILTCPSSDRLGSDFKAVCSGYKGFFKIKKQFGFLFGLFIHLYALKIFAFYNFDIVEWPQHLKDQ